ncbi:unnamed protein product [Adineta steineri]|uniref:Cadherin domain-containing protein n=1 Tax=Adineta steineri TaxID=433720 RepID=A0A818WVF3_9BILA|nr:unnamed protein product [Adineta steineri]CAF3728922.1 unnamed protein product [Adineta steineri]
MINHLWILFILIQYSFSKTSITNYPTVDLFENSPLNTLVIQLTTSLNITKSSKLALLNMIGFELDMFSIINGSIYTIDFIDREEFITEKYCLDNLYCKIELHILVNDGLAYWVIPIHIIDENDNKPEFIQNEIELKFRENILNGYKIPFSGAKDLDEGRNGEIHYVLDCSNDLNQNKTFINQYIQSSINCYPLFQLIILSQSPPSSINFDRLALKFLPSSSINIQSEYKLKLYAIDNSDNGKQLDNSMNLNIKIERKEKEPIFSLSQYEFVVTINSSLYKNESIIGRVHAISNDPSQIIHYKLVSDNNKIKINSLTGELIYINENFHNISNEIDFLVQASILSKEKLSKILISRSKVKIIFRYLNLINNVSFHFQTNSLKNQNKIHRLNSSNSFLIDEHLQSNEDLLNITLISFYYPMDKYILSLDNYLTIFSLAATPSLNIYMLKTRRRPASKAIYMLNIGVKHKLSQQWLPNLRIELIVIDQWTTTTASSSSSSTTTVFTRTTTANMIITNTSVYVEPLEFCIENKNYILYEIKNDTMENKIGFFRVIETNLFILNNRNLSLNLFLFINQSEIIINECRMYIERLDNSFNNSLEYRLCSFSNDDECYNITTSDLSRKNENNLQKWFLPMKPIEIIMFILSIIFILVTIILILLICRLKGIHICLTIKNYIFYGKKYGLNTTTNQHLSSSSPSSPPSKMTQRVHSIVIRDSRSPSFEPIRMKNDIDEPYIFNIDHLLQREPLPSTNMFTLPSSAQLSSSSSITCSLQREGKIRLNIENRPITTTTHRTSSSSSFLQETKQLLEMISTNQNSDSSRLASEV